MVGARRAGLSPSPANVVTSPSLPFLASLGGFYSN
jgi:hypothetical protein